MTYKNSIQLKAAFLLLVFTLNIIIGFACAMGLDMGFNPKHHHDNSNHSASLLNHPHDNSKHSDALVNHHHSNHSASLANQHLHNNDSHHEENIAKNNSGTDDNCCNEKVVKISEQDKILTLVIHIGVPLALVPLLSSLYLTYFASSAKITRGIQVVRCCLLTSRGIRVLIQSFQI